MKKYFFDLLLELMDRNKDIYILFCGLGYPRYDEFKRRYPERVFNTEASEQSALDIACGLAVSGKIPLVYSIAPFLLWRGAETIRTYINHEKLNVKLIGAGRDDDYKHDGFSHNASDDRELLNCFSNIQPYWPVNNDSLKEILSVVIKNNEPTYINLTR